MLLDIWFKEIVDPTGSIWHKRLYLCYFLPNINKIIWQCVMYGTHNSKILLISNKGHKCDVGLYCQSSDPAVDPDTMRRFRLGSEWISPLIVKANLWSQCVVCEGRIYDPNGSGIQILGIKSRDPFSGSMAWPCLFLPQLGRGSRR